MNLIKLFSLIFLFNLNFQSNCMVDHEPVAQEEQKEQVEQDLKYRFCLLCCLIEKRGKSCQITKAPCLKRDTYKISNGKHDCCCCEFVKNENKCSKISCINCLCFQCQRTEDLSKIESCSCGICEDCCCINYQKHKLSISCPLCCYIAEDGHQSRISCPLFCCLEYNFDRKK